MPSLEAATLSGDGCHPLRLAYSPKGVAGEPARSPVWMTDISPTCRTFRAGAFATMVIMHETGPQERACPKCAGVVRPRLVAGVAPGGRRRGRRSRRSFDPIGRREPRPDEHQRAIRSRANRAASGPIGVSEGEFVPPRRPCRFTGSDIWPTAFTVGSSGRHVALFVLAGSGGAFYVRMQGERDTSPAAEWYTSAAARVASKQLGAAVETWRATVSPLVAARGSVAALGDPRQCSLSFAALAGIGSGHLDILRSDGSVACSSHQPPRLR